MTDDRFPPLRPHPTLRWFDSRHLRPPLFDTAVRFFDLAQWIDDELPDGAEKSTALRKLLEAKDAAVRATIEGQDT